MGTKVGDVPKISDVLGAKPVIKKPVRPLVVTAQTLIADQIKTERQCNLSEKVLSADVIPKKYPVRASAFSYPETAKRGATNPLYGTSSQAYGKEVPMDHQVPDRFFPSGNEFTKGFVDLKPRYTGLSCAPSLSKVHSALDEHY